MITLDYELSPEWDRSTSEIDVRSADELTLRYDCFLGDVVFVVDSADFSARWGWVPVLDFALGLRAVTRSLLGGNRASFEFTESDATIEFRREVDTVTIDANYTPAGAQAAHAELLAHTERFVSRVVSDLCGRYADLASNPFIVDLSR